MKLLLTSGWVTNPGIRDALIDLLGKPIAEAGALCERPGLEVAGCIAHPWAAALSCASMPGCLQEYLRTLRPRMVVLFLLGAITLQDSWRFTAYRRLVERRCNSACRYRLRRRVICPARISWSLLSTGGGSFMRLIRRVAASISCTACP